MDHLNLDSLGSIVSTTSLSRLLLVAIVKHAACVIQCPISNDLYPTSSCSLVGCVIRKSIIRTDGSVGPMTLHIHLPVDI